MLSIALLSRHEITLDLAIMGGFTLMNNLGRTTWEQSLNLCRQQTFHLSYMA